MNVGQAAKNLNLTGSRVRDLLREGKLKGEKVGPRKWEVSESAIQEYLRKFTPDSPLSKGRLRLGVPRVEVCVQDPWVARYASVEVKADSELEARECLALVKVLPSGPEMPLHWARVPVSEYGMLRIPINPNLPEYLQLAVTVPVGRVPADVFPNAVRRWEVAAYIGGPPWDGEGCWLADPVALDFLDPGKESFLPPGEHHIKIRVGCPGMEGDTAEYIIVSPRYWEGLEVKLV